MTKFNKQIKASILILSMFIYLSFIFVNFSYADPSGAAISNPDVDTGPTSSAGQRNDTGGTITTIDIDVNQQNIAWKAYVGNITGKLVLRNSDDKSIYEWDLASETLSGNIFVTRLSSVSWDISNLICANESAIQVEEGVHGMTTSDSDNINNTFNYTIHKTMTISGIGNIQNSTCQSMATYVNGSIQTINEANTTFQEFLLYDKSNIGMVYATFIDQDSDSFRNNVSLNTTYDFQLIVAENRTATIGTTYYFYADIS